MQIRNGNSTMIVVNRVIVEYTDWWGDYKTFKKQMIQSIKNIVCK